MTVILEHKDVWDVFELQFSSWFEALVELQLNEVCGTIFVFAERVNKHCMIWRCLKWCVNSLHLSFTETYRRNHHHHISQNTSNVGYRILQVLPQQTVSVLLVSRWIWILAGRRPTLYAVGTFQNFTTPSVICPASNGPCPLSLKFANS